MTLFEIVAFYIGLNILLLLILSVRVVRTRRRSKISLGHGDNEELLKATRVQGNFTEYTPFALIGLVMMAALNATPIVLHVTGILLTFGRVLHAIAITKGPKWMNGRVGGMMCTFIVLAFEAVYLIHFAIN